MSFTWRANPVPPKDAFKAIKKVVELTGENKAYFNVGEFYGPLLTNYKLLQSYFNNYPEDRKKVIIGAKGAVDAVAFRPTGDSKAVAQSIERTLKEFNGYLDVFEPARLDMALAKQRGESLFPRESFDTIVEYVKQGKVGGISLSEVNAEQIKAIHKEYGDYLVCVEVELSLASPDIIHNGVLATCNELGLPVIAYSPLGRGLLTGAIKKSSDIPKGDVRNVMKRFQGEALDHNQQLTQFLETEIANKRADKPSLAQVAIGWIHGISKRYENTTILPIPSGTTVEKVTENFSFIELTDDEMKKIDKFLSEFKLKGGRIEFSR